MTEPESREYLVSKEGAAHAQLETAIWLWVTRDDPVSIHTLAASSNEILHALGSKIGQPSIHREWLKEQPKRIQKLVFEPQNFFKHAFTDKRGVKLHYFPLQAEILMFDAVACWKVLFEKLPLPPMLQLFGAYFVINRCDSIEVDLWEHFFDDLDTEKLRGLDRMRFFMVGLQDLATAGRFTPKTGPFTGFGW